MFVLWPQKQQNLGNRVCVFRTKAQMRVPFDYPQNSVNLQMQTVILLNFRRSTEITTFMHNLPALSNISKLLIGFHSHRILQT